MDSFMFDLLEDDCSFGVGYLQFLARFLVGSLDKCFLDYILKGNVT